MNPRGRYPPGIGNGRGGSAGPNPPNFYPRGPQLQQQYMQRNIPSDQQNQQIQQQQQQQRQQWLRRNLMNQVEVNSGAMAKMVSSDVKDSSSQDWKAQLKIPPSDTRYKTEVKLDLEVSIFLDEEIA